MPMHHESSPLSRHVGKMDDNPLQASTAQVFGHRLAARVRVQFLVNAPDIGLDGRHADLQVIGNFLRHITLDDQIEHLLLPWRELYAV